ncbi:MAG TPA: LuxR C-terminal-related transcriptional regulator, partial [Solirubrobacterales bacterium]|nr:LuxR C-terminal-related transcriptional regulator [Solirubrobacterales bacterium]
VAEACGALGRSEILRPEPPVAFVHSLVREAIYQDLSVGERELHHERAARALTAAGATPEQVATHLLHVPRRGQEWVVETLRAAAGSAVAKGAPESAVAYLKRALEEPPPGALEANVLFELGSAEASTSGPDAIVHLRAARAGLADEEKRAVAANVLIRNMLVAGSPSAAAEVAREAAAELPPQLERMGRSFEALAQAAVFFGVGEFTELDRLDSLQPPPADAPVFDLLLAAMAAYTWTYRCRPAEECAAMALASHARDLEILTADNSVISVAALMPLAYADREEALSGWDASAAEAHRRGSTFDISGVHLWRGATLLQRGELPEAAADLRAAVEDQRVFGSSEIPRSYTAGFLASALLAQGDVAGAWAALGDGYESAAGTDGRRFWLESRLELLLAEGRDEEVLRIADDLRDAYAWALNPVVARWRSGKARALDRLGRGEEALAVLAEELELARAYGAPGTVGRVLRELGALEREAGLERLEEAVAVLDGPPCRLELAKALGAQGAALRLARKPKEARDPLRRALELAEACGAAPLEAHVRSELQAAGVRPRSTALSGVESLTASEKRVAGLAADGGTNRDIAQELFVTPKTVEVHLSNTYRKLGISSRRQLPAALAAVG